MKKYQFRIKKICSSPKESIYCPRRDFAQREKSRGGNTNIMRNIYPNLLIKMLSENKRSLYIFFQISAVCIGICAYMHATFLVVEMADRFLGQALYGYILLTNNHQSNFVLSASEGNVDLLQS